MIKIIDYNWSKLKIVCPLEVDNLVNHAEYIESIIGSTIPLDKMDEYKEKLILASGELEIMITKLISLLYDIESIKTDIDKALFSFLKDDLTGYIALIDDRQNKLLEVHDGQPMSGVGRTAAFKKVIRVALYGIIYESLYTASMEWRKMPREQTNKEGQVIKKDSSAFLRILFFVMSINLSTLGGLPRRKAISGGGSSFGLKTDFKPSSWKALFTKSGEENIKSEYKDAYGHNLEEFLDEEDFEDGKLD